MTRPGKRKATDQAIGPERTAPTLNTRVDLQTIETLQPIACTISPAQMTTDNLASSFPSLSVAQQQIDLWTIFQSPNFKDGTPYAQQFRTWLNLRRVTLDDVLEWRHGVQANSLPHTKPSGAKLATAAVKRFKILQEEESMIAKGDMLKALRQKEMDYTMLMLGTQLHNIDNMIPDHNARINQLSELLQTRAEEPTHATFVRHKEVVQSSSQGGETEDHSYEIALDFVKEGITDIPKVVGHTDIAKKISDQMRIPVLFGHLLAPAERTGSQTFLLFGPPGTGKTLFAQSLANQYDATFFKVDSATMTSQWMGGTEKIIKALSDLATERAPSLVFIDEIDSITRAREGMEASFDRRTKNRLLEMFNRLSETPSVFLIGATNRPWDLDDAFLSRFQQKVFFSLPRQEDYMKMLSDYLKDKKADIPDYQIDILCTFMRNYSGREVANAFRALTTRMFTELMNSRSFAPVESEGQLYHEPCAEDYDSRFRVDRPFNEWPVESLRPRAITWSDIQEALGTIKPSVTEDVLKRYENWSLKFGVRSV